MCEFSEYIKVKADEILDKASDIYQRSFYNVEYKFTLTGKTAGTCGKRGENFILNYNIGIFKENQSDFDQTIVHEIAHFVAYEVYGYRIKPHGREWQWVMLDLGCKPRRCHNYKGVKPARKLKRFIYKCNCQEHELTSIRHNRIKKGEKYICRVCKQTLTLKGEK